MSRGRGPRGPVNGPLPVANRISRVRFNLNWQWPAISMQYERLMERSRLPMERLAFACDEPREEVPRHCPARGTRTHAFDQVVAIEIGHSLMMGGAFSVRPRRDKGPAAMVAVGPQCVGAGLEVVLGRGARTVHDRAVGVQRVIGRLRYTRAASQ